MAGYTVDAIDLTKLHALVPQMQSAFGIAHNETYFQWKYRDNPAGSAIGHIARSADGELAAFYAMIPEEYRFGAKRRLLFQGCNVNTAPKHRRKGLFNRLFMTTFELGKSADPEFFFIGFGGDNTISGYRKMGVTVPFAIPFYFKPRIFCQLVRLLRRPSAAIHETPTPSLLAMIKAKEASRMNSKTYDEDFVRWRLANPMHRYQYIVGEDAYAIFYESDSFLFLFDGWESSPTSGNAVMARLDELAVRHSRKGILTFCQRGTEYEAYLKRYRYIRNDLGRGPASLRVPFLTYGEGPYSRQLNAGSAWSITPFDHDSY